MRRFIFRKLGPFTDAELLRPFIETGPRSIVPERAIGGFAPDQEAGFPALDGDPTEDFAKVWACDSSVDRSRCFTNRANYFCS